METLADEMEGEGYPVQFVVLSDANAADFVAQESAHLLWFHATQPNLEQLQDHVEQELRTANTFGAAVWQELHPYDFLFLLLGVATAGGIVAQRTNNIRMTLLADRRRKEETARSLAAHEAAQQADGEESSS